MNPQRRARVVGDIFGRTEDDGMVTFWRITEIHRDRYGTAVTSAALPGRGVHNNTKGGVRDDMVQGR